MSDNSGGFWKPFKDGWFENLCKVTGAIWIALFVLASLGLINPMTPDQWASSLHWGRVLNDKASSIFGSEP